MIDKHTIQFELENSLSQEDLRKFLMTLHTSSSAKGRLFYWQERMLSTLCQKLGIAQLSFQDAMSLFNYCFLHHEELVEGTVPIQYGTRSQEPNDQTAHALETFPYANVVAFGPCWVEEATHTKVFFCPACRQALSAEKSYGRA